MLNKDFLNLLKYFRFSITERFVCLKGWAAGHKSELIDVIFTLCSRVDIFLDPKSVGKVALHDLVCVET